jgi:hypothetical protein
LVAQWTDYLATPGGATPGGATPGAAQAGGPPVPPTGQTPPSQTPPSQPRTILLLVDEANIRSGAARLAANAATAFVGRMRPDDRIGLVTIPFSSTRVAPTTDRAVLAKALQRITGHLNPARMLQSAERSVGLSEAFALQNDKRTWGQVVTRECLEKRGGFENDNRGVPAADCVSELEQLARALVADARELMLTSARAITAAIEALATMPGPKTVVLLSEELPVPSNLAGRKDFLWETAGVSALPWHVGRLGSCIRRRTRLDASRHPVQRRRCRLIYRHSGQGCRREGTQCRIFCSQTGLRADRCPGVLDGRLRLSGHRN